jgi:predicted DCC family thiol-disulfide oxidoreductase YuxK
MSSPVFLYDQNCGFCRMWVAYWKQLTGPKVSYEPVSEKISSVQLTLPSGEKFSAAHAVFRLLAEVPGKEWYLWLYRNVPGVNVVSEFAYRLVASCRHCAFHVTTFLWGKRIAPSSFVFVRSVFFRLLGLIYAIAFISFWVQAKGLIGSNGITPSAIPDWLLPLLCLLGAAFGVVILLGIHAAPVFLVPWALYLVLFWHAQPWLGFQWDTLLLEVGFLAFFFALAATPFIWLYRVLLFRLMFGSGLVKLLSGDEAWRGLTALNYHFETQPLPNTIAWYVHQLPAWLDRGAVLATFVVQLVMPFFIFAPRRLRYVAAFCFIGLESLIALTGNYTFFNLLSIALCLLLFDDRALSFGRVVKPFIALARPLVLRFATALFVCFILLLGLSHLPGISMPTISPLEDLHLANRYGLFAVMTTRRVELVVQGSEDAETWRSYEFRYKPGEVHRAPPFVAPHQPRLDWQMWFAALGTYRSQPWLVAFASRLLQGSEEVSTLLETNPFPDAPPKFIRVVAYAYRFTDPVVKRDTGAWWMREYLGVYLPPVSLEQKRVTE